MSMLHPKTDVITISWVEKIRHTFNVPKHGRGRWICSFFLIFCFYISLSQFPNTDWPSVFLFVTLLTSQSFTGPDSHNPLTTLLQQNLQLRFSAISGHRQNIFKTSWIEWNKLLRGGLCCFQSQITLPLHWSKTNSLPKLPTIHNGCGQAGQQSSLLQSKIENRSYCHIPKSGFKLIAIILNLIPQMI